jgi:hypothetical protein
MIFADGGRNTVNGDNGNDLLCGGIANDTLNGGDDALNGGNGNDILRGSTGNDTLTGSAGADTFSGGPVRIPSSTRVRVTRRTAPFLSARGTGMRTPPNRSDLSLARELPGTSLWNSQRDPSLSPPGCTSAGRQQADRCDPSTTANPP